MAEEKKQNNISTSIGKQQDIEKNKALAIVSYLWILCIIPYVVKSNSEYVMFHAKQGIVLTIAWFILWIVGIVPLLGWLIFFFGSILLFVVNIVAIIKAWQGEEWKIPYLHQYVAKLNL